MAEPEALGKQPSARLGQEEGLSLEQAARRIAGAERSQSKGWCNSTRQSGDSRSLRSPALLSLLRGTLARAELYLNWAAVGEAAVLFPEKPLPFPLQSRCRVLTAFCETRPGLPLRCALCPAHQPCAISPAGAGWPWQAAGTRGVAVEDGCPRCQRWCARVSQAKATLLQCPRKPEVATTWCCVAQGCDFEGGCRV